MKKLKIEFIDGPIKVGSRHYKRGDIVKTYISTYFIVESIRLETGKLWSNSNGYILLRSFNLIGPIEYVDLIPNYVMPCPVIDYMKLKELWGNKVNTLAKGLNYKTKGIITMLERVNHETKSNKTL